jgi:hypothetical protein
MRERYGSKSSGDIEACCTPRSGYDANDLLGSESLAWYVFGPPRDTS